MTNAAVSSGLETRDKCAGNLLCSSAKALL
jgi:hypothetical protein